VHRTFLSFTLLACSYLGVYALLVFLTVSVFSIVNATYVFGFLRACRHIHKIFVASILGTTLRWLDTTPVSRIITRATQDISTSMFCSIS
jgi:hypothetical protein